MYKITDINSEEKTIAVEFHYKEHQLNHTSSVEDITDEKAITEQVEKDFEAYRTEIDNAPQKVDLPDPVESLIGEEVETEE